MFGIVTNALVMRMLPTAQERDAYVLALSIVSLGAVVGSLGLPKTVVRLIAENMGVDRTDRTRQAIRTVLGLGVLGTLGISLAYLLMGDLVSNLLNSPVLVALTGLMAGWIAIAVVQEITAEAFRSFHDMRHGRGEEQDRQEEPRPKEGREAVRHPLSTSAGGRRRPRARSRSTSRPARPGVVWRRSCASPGPP
jgi:hypothetical protein